MSEQELRAQTAWRNAVVAVFLNIVGMALELLVVRTIPHVPAWPPVMSIGAGFVLLGILLAHRDHPSARLGHAVFLLNVLVTLTALWLVDAGYASSGRTWAPFQEYKLAMVTVAVLAPEGWVGLISITAYAAAAIVQLATFPPSVHAHLALGEPWATIAFATFAFVLLWYRLARAALELEHAITREKLVSTEHFAKVLLAVRDLANTPLQTIAFAAETAREMHPDVGPVMDHVERALDKLRVLDERLRKHDRAVTWTTGDESFDAGAVASGAIRYPR